MKLEKITGYINNRIRHYKIQRYKAEIKAIQRRYLERQDDNPFGSAYMTRIRRAGL